MIRVAIIGVGNMGSKYASIIQSGAVPELTLAAITRVRGAYRELLSPSLEAGLPVYENAGALFDAIESGQLEADAVIIATPHYAHEESAVRAFRNGLHVLCEKPSGVYSRQAREMEEAAEKAVLNTDGDLAEKTAPAFGIVFNQRTLPVYQRLRELVQSGVYGKLKRVNWVVTDWYRPDPYYAASSWHAAWSSDGGGIILNQCPHNLDLLQWICGMPARVQAFCKEGHYHDIEVEDDVTAYFEWADGASGTFITSTGDAPGLNRLEISLDEAMIVCENGKLRIGTLQEELGMKEADYRRTSEDFFRKIRGTWHEETPPAEPAPYVRILKDFAAACCGTGACTAPGPEGRKSLMISNAIYLSSWEKRMVELPAAGSEAERAFEQDFEAWLERKKQGKI